MPTRSSLPSARFCLLRTAIAALVFGCFLLNSANAQTFRAAHRSDGFTVFEYAIINDNGVVVFTAQRLDSSGKRFRGVYKSTGGSIRTVAESSLLDPVPPDQINVLGGAGIWINNRSLVALSGFYQGFARIFVGSGSIGPAQEVSAILSGGLLPTIADNGYVAYGRLVQPYPYDPASLLQPCTTCFGQGRLNNRQEYLMMASTNIHIVTVGTVRQAGDSRIFIQPVRTNRVASVSANGFGGAMLNDNGKVAFFHNPSAGVFGLYKDPATLVVEQRTGSEFTFNGNPPFALNNQEQVAFLAHSRTFGKFGFFRGPSPFSDKIVVEGDIVAGSQLFGLSGAAPVDRWFNNRGQIVFRAGDNNGVGLWVTDGVASPPPTNATATLHWVGPGITPPSGLFGSPNNWQPPQGESPRVPEKTITRRDIAVFDRPETYTVTIGDRYNEGAVVRNGNVTFIDGNYKVDALSFSQPSFVIDNARLTLGTGMTLTNTHALIGQSAASRVDVNFFGKWVTHGSLRVGGPGQGILTVNDGGWVKSGEARIGTGAGGGRVIVTDTGKWTNGNLAIGMGGAGVMIVTNGGYAESEFTSAGAQLGSSGQISILDSTASSRTTWRALAAAIGDKSIGTLQVTNGALADVELYLKVGAELSGVGRVSVSGVDAQQQSASLITTELHVGLKGQGTLSVLNGGSVKAEDIGIGTQQGGLGTVLVDGVHSASAIPSTVSIANNLVIGASGGFGSANFQGLTGRGSLEIKNGGTVEVGNGYIFSSQAGRRNEVIVSGANSDLIVTNLLIVGYTGNLGEAVLTLIDGYVEAPDVTINHNGIIRGNGTLATIIRTTNDNGTISPGLSPGTLTIRGSYEQGPNGRLLMEFGGTNSSDYDHLIITNAATLDGNVTFRFINGFAPKAGNQFDFLSAGGTVSGAFANVGLQNLAPGFQFNVAANGPLLSMTALNDGVFSSALPGIVQVTVTNVGGITYAVCVATTTNTCETITLDGSLTQTNNVFTQAFQGTTFIRGDCATEMASITNMIVLGALTPGNYSFRIMSQTQLVETVPFTIPSVSTKTLRNPMRLADGSLQFEVDGLPPIGYTIEASEDLENWSPLESGILPFTYIDPDAAILPRRYYRALINL